MAAGASSSPALIVCVLGIRAATLYEAVTGRKDAKEIIIDEVAGQWIALLVVPLDWRWWLAAFCLFRLFDILKPGPVKMAEGFSGGLGVMADDIVAGVLAAFVFIWRSLHGGDDMRAAPCKTATPHWQPG